MRFSLLLFLTLVATGCDGHTRISGRVIDERGDPVEGARIGVFQGSSEIDIGATSDARGQFEAGGTHGPGWYRITLVVRKEGFKDGSQQLSPNEKHDNVRVVLERKSHPVWSRDSAQP